MNNPWAAPARRAESFGRGLQLALALGAGRVDGADAMLGPDPARAAALSFYAMLVCIPALLLIEAANMHAHSTATATAIPAWHTVSADVLSSAASWLAFLAVVHAVAMRRGIAAKWPRFVVLWNWSNLTQIVLLAAAAATVWLPLPDAVRTAVWLSLTGWALMV